MKILRFLANIVWLICGGLISALLFLVAGLLCCITIIGIPLGLQLFKFARLVLHPFGRKVRLNFSSHTIANVIWLVLLGWESFLGMLAASIACCITIVGIPVGIQAFKFSILSLAPFGAEVERV